LFLSFSHVQEERLKTFELAKNHFFIKNKNATRSVALQPRVAPQQRELQLAASQQRELQLLQCPSAAASQHRELLQCHSAAASQHCELL
jgi:hypothetical protein